MTVYYCCDAFKTAAEFNVRYFKAGDRWCYYVDDAEPVDKAGWYLYSDEYGIEHQTPIKYCPWCAAKL